MLNKLEGKGWTLVQPPDDYDEPSVVARYNGEPIRAGFTMEEREGDNEMYFKFRSGQYDVELKVDFEVAHGQIKVTKAEGYEASA